MLFIILYHGNQAIKQLVIFNYDLTGLLCEINAIYLISTNICMYLQWQILNCL